MIDDENRSRLDSMQSHQYSMSIFFRILCYGWVVFAIVCVINIPDWGFDFYTLVAIVSGFYAFMLATFARLTITADAVTCRGAFLTKSIQQRDIVGYRMRHQKGAATLVLASRHGNGGSLGIPMVFGTDAYFDGWLNSIPAM